MDLAVSSLKVIVEPVDNRKVVTFESSKLASVSLSFTGNSYSKCSTVPTLVGAKVEHLVKVPRNGNYCKTLQCLLPMD